VKELYTEFAEKKKDLYKDLTCSVFRVVHHTRAHTHTHTHTHKTRNLCSPYKCCTHLSTNIK